MEAERIVKAEAECLANVDANELEKTKTIKGKSSLVEDDVKSSKVLKSVSQFSGRSIGYEQYLELSLRSLDFPCLGLNYIGGYRFNQHLFLGVGAGLDLYYGDGIWVNERRGDFEIYDYPGSSYTDLPFTFPLYANLRVNFKKTRWSPYVSVLAGCRFSASEKSYIDVCDEYVKTRANVPMSSVDFGISKAMKNGKALCFSVGISLEGEGREYYGYSASDCALYKESMDVQGFYRFTIGFSF